MNTLARGINKLYLFSFLYMFIFFAGSGIYASAAEQVEPQQFMEITVLDKTTDEPLSGAKVNVRIIQDNGGDIREEIITDEKGICSVPIEDKIIENFRLNVVKNGYAPYQMSQSSSATQPQISTQHTIYLDKGTKIGGLVQDELGNPIEGVAVSISLQSSNRNNTAVISGHEEKTNSNGLWTCDIIPEQPERITIRFTDPNYRTETLNVQSPSPIMQLLQEMSHVLVMQTQLNLTGHVLDTFGNPIEGALVAQGADRRSFFYPSTETDSKGSYIFENIKPGEMVLTVQAEGYSPDTMRFMVEKQMPPIMFRLEPGHTITGRVIDPNGEPVPDVTLSADTWHQSHSLTWETKTDANGVFVWNSAPADEVMININKRRYIIIRNYIIKPSEKEYEITLVPELVIRGSIVDANSGEPVNEFRFYPGVDGSAGEDISWKPGGKITKSNEYLMRFTYPSNEYYIRVEAEGYQPQVSRAVTGKEGDVTLDFKLEKIVPIRGTVLSVDAKPVENAEVMIVTRQLIVENGKAGARPSSDKLSATTDSKGNFSFPPPPDEYSIVILHDEGYAFLSKDQFPSDGNITLSGWSKLEGTLKIADKPGKDETITYNPKSVPQLSGIVFNFQTKTDENGHFVFDRIFSGEGTVTRLLRTRSNLQQNTHTMLVNIMPNETKEIQIGGTGRPVTGKIIIPDPIRRRTNWQNIEGNLNITSENNPYLAISFNIENDGSFKIDDVPEGEYSLYIQAYDLESRVTQISKEQIASLSHQFNVTESESNEALALGEMELVISGDAVASQSLIGKTLPDFDDITLDSSIESFQSKSLLVCFWDYEQRPSRNCILELNKKAEELKSKNIEIIAIQIAQIERETLDNWLSENNITMTIGTAGENESKVRFKWAVKYLPWMVLTDSKNKVFDEGFGINELDERIEKLSEIPEEIAPDFI
ncbi:MAG: carboxypeptidase regulatory-like domain-containing protein [Sedimentisphaerales bacterium]|nr:carboxypeptidase regulatory-like domain-containing protein [Sedimentisphaerales bacterium]